jgi:hypothetical protein
MHDERMCELVAFPKQKRRCATLKTPAAAPFLQFRRSSVLAPHRSLALLPSLLLSPALSASAPGITPHSLLPHAHSCSQATDAAELLVYLWVFMVQIGTGAAEVAQPSQ